MQKIRENGFDYFKGCACIAVILIHCYFPNNIGIAIRTLCRFAVPVFFVVSGYFMLTDEDLCIRAKTIKKIKHITTMLIGAGVFYFFFDIIRSLLTNYGGKGFQEYIKQLITGINIIKFFVTNNPLRYAHLWFLMALIYCYILMLLFDKTYPRKLVNSFPILMIVFLIFGLWNNSLHLRASINGKIYIKNLFVLRALPFFLAGMWLKKNRKIIDKWNISECKLIIAIFLGSILGLIERAVFMESQFYFGSYIVVAAMMIYALKYNYKFRSDNFIVYIGRELSTYIYIIHIAVGHTVNLIATKHGISMKKFSYVNMFFVLAISILLSQCIVSIRKLRLTKSKTINH